MRGDAGRIIERGEQRAHDPQARLLPAALEDVAAYRVFEAGRTEAPSAGQVAAVTLDDDAQAGEPGVGTERLPGGLQHRGPDALEQVTHLLHLTRGLGDQLLAAGTEMPQPGPRLIDRFGFIAAQLRRESGDEDRVLLIGLVRRQVLDPPRVRRHRRLHTHQRHPASRGEFAEHPPPVPGRLTRHRRSGEPLPSGTIHGPAQRRTEIPRLTAVSLAGQHLPVVITDHDHLLPVRQIDPDDRVLDQHQRP